MTKRRDFIKGAAAGGVMFCGCGVTPAQAQSSPPNLSYRHPDSGRKHKPVMVGGKRVKTIDVHSHCFFKDAIEAAGPGISINAPVKGSPEHYIQVTNQDMVKVRLDAMDAMGIDMEVLSVNPFWYKAERDRAAEIVKLNNTHLGELCAAHPKRFSAFATLSLQYPDLAVEQLGAAMKMPGFRGAGIGGSVAGVDFSDPKFHPVWAKAEELGAVLFVHPQSTPQLASRFKGNGWMANTVGNPLDTTIALQHLIYEGTLDKFPGLKVLAAHGGGYLGSYAPRMDHSCFVSPAGCNPEIVLKKRPTEYLNQMYFDALVFTPEALRHLVAQVGASQVMIGTDHPIPWEDHPVEHVMATASLTPAQKAAILGGNAAKLLKITEI
ncbi:MAG TPA: amidohydrolase family protein [Burkholderiales bacterium]|jgi:aminocarboxymuconate-semialdehyde decarboxylase|nr:amidohydrolase family protein [Burkholderiales bacterium]